MTDRATHESAWVSAHAFYQDNLDPLVVEVVAPLMDELAAEGLARESFFLRYWDGGPHVRLRALPVQGEFRPDVEKLIMDRFGEYLAKKPSAESMPPEEYARLAPVLASGEGMSSYFACLQPNNSVSFIPYRREHNRYGYGAAVEAAERHFAESSRIALSILRRGATDGQRLTAAAAMILATWFVANPDPERLRLWIADRRGDVPELSGTERDRSGSTDERQQDLVGLARQMRALAGSHTRSPAGGTLVDWARSISLLRDVLAAEAASGAFTPPARASGRPGRISALDPAAGVPTVLDICSHLVCNRLGVSPDAEVILRRLSAEAVGELSSEEG
jgi:hypothetical protein